ncbi:hypothetical protein SteCoe_24279 [Stentor coeruleus]|uniref:Protein kinase domain-containing protein n=1 Tax=Stentor coeruleus TaxID=5963 RepID=A0A1R2BHZ5_9CILI|nr:hypothetical protein SteCoe_24279 [Stentor coeruleus]
MENYYREYIPVKTLLEKSNRIIFLATPKMQIQDSSFPKQYVIKKIIANSVPIEISIQKELCKHSNTILKIYDDWNIDNQYFLCMEFCSGEDLHVTLSKLNEHPFEWSFILQKCYELCWTVNLMHSLRIVHRDIKPLNIYITESLEFKLADFGESKILGPDEEITSDYHTIRGTPYYMSPETRARFNKSRDTKNNPFRDDIWGLARTFIEISLGKLCPEVASLLGEELKEYLLKNFKRFNYPDNFAELIYRMMPTDLNSGFLQSSQVLDFLKELINQQITESKSIQDPKSVISFEENSKNILKTTESKLQNSLSNSDALKHSQSSSSVFKSVQNKPVNYQMQPPPPPMPPVPPDVYSSKSFTPSPPQPGLPISPNPFPNVPITNKELQNPLKMPNYSGNMPQNNFPMPIAHLPSLEQPKPEKNIEEREFSSENSDSSYKSSSESVDMSMEIRLFASNSNITEEKKIPNESSPIEKLVLTNTSSKHSDPTYKNEAKESFSPQNYESSGSANLKQLQNADKKSNFASINSSSNQNELLGRKTAVLPEVKLFNETGVDTIKPESHAVNYASVPIILQVPEVECMICNKLTKSEYITLKCKHHCHRQCFKDEYNKKIKNSKKNSDIKCKSCLQVIPAEFLSNLSILSVKAKINAMCINFSSINIVCPNCSIDTKKCMLSKKNLKPKTKKCKKCNYKYCTFCLVIGGHRFFCDLFKDFKKGSSFDNSKYLMSGIKK